MRSDPGTLVFQRSRLRTALVLALVPIMVGVSYGVAIYAGDVVHRAVGWLGVVFFGAAAFPILHALWKGGVALTMDGHGFTDARSGLGTIPWSEVTECFVVSVEGQRLLCLRLRNAELLFGPLPLRKRMLHSTNLRMGFGDVAITFTALRPSLDEALAFIRNLGTIPVL
jgi:hypothetical protein